MNLSRAEQADLPAILALQYAAYQSEAEIYQAIIPPLTQTLSELEQEFNEGMILIASLDNEIVGSVRAVTQDGICYIGKLIVKPTFQNQGIGKRLMQEIEAYHPHVKRKELFTGHRSTKNIAFYEKLGYAAFEEVEVNESLHMIYMYKED